MNSEIKSLKIKLNKIIKEKKILDVIVFGSFIKGKAVPGDIDIAVIGENKEKLNLEGFHFSFLNPMDFFKERIPLLTTLFREGYSLKFNKYFSELYGFNSRILFKYELNNLDNSKKVKIVNILRGKTGERGLVVENEGEWLANQVFFIPITKDYIFDRFFVNFGVKFKKFYILMH